MASEAYYTRARRRMAGWVDGGELRYREDVVVALEKAPATFIGLMTRENLGKLLVRVSDEWAPSGVAGRRHAVHE